MKFGYPTASAVLCLLGTLNNAASIVYFVKKQGRSIGDKLLMLLNSLDLLLCILAMMMSIFGFIHYVLMDSLSREANERFQTILHLSMVLHIAFIDGTAYATCLLSVTRTIGIAFPFYQVKGKLLVKTGIIVFIVMELSDPAASVAIAVLAPQSHVSVRLSIILNYLIGRIVTTSLLILVVVSATVVAVYKLTRENLRGGEGRVSRNNRINRNTRKVTWTVVILSTLFFFFNSIFLGITAFVVLFQSKGDVSVDMALFGGAFIAIPLNSAINPIVYMVRKSDMRQFFRQGFRSFFRVGQRTEPQ